MTTTITTDPVTANTFAIVEHVTRAMANQFTTLHGHSPAALATHMPVDADTCGRALRRFLTTHRDPHADPPAELDLDGQARADLINDLAEVALCVLIGIAYLDGDLATVLTDQAARGLDLLNLAEMLDDTTEETH